MIFLCLFFPKPISISSHSTSYDVPSHSLSSPLSSRLASYSPILSSFPSGIPFHTPLSAQDYNEIKLVIKLPIELHISYLNSHSMRNQSKACIIKPKFF